MTNKHLSRKSSKSSCITDEDLYRYISGQEGTGKLSQIEAHLSECPSCRQNLAQLLEILHPDIEESTETHDPSKAELDRTIDIIQRISPNEYSPRNLIPRWIQWPIAAIVLLGFVALSFLGINSLLEKHKSEVFFSQAKAEIEKNYSGTSPSNLRLSLPFNQISINRGESASETFATAENLLFQALAVRGGMINAHLGLGFIYLNESKLANARNEFQKILDIRKDQTQALLGRGVAQYEEAMQNSDPLQRENLLKNAISDFDAVLKLDPESAEARYNKIWALFESGLHPNALQEIEIYLAHDPSSTWAEGLKSLRTRIKATKSSAVEDEVNRAARTRDRTALVELSRQAPYQMPDAIWSAMRRSLAEDKIPAVNGSPASKDLCWAAEIIEDAYATSTGDHSFRAFIDFHNGLSPPNRKIKKSLDQKLQTLDVLYQHGKFDLVLQSSKPLEIQYAKIKDSWQLARLHHLLGNSLYVGKADFRAAECEFRKMHEISKRLNAPALEAKALRGLEMVYVEQRKFDQSTASGNMAKTLAGKYKLDSLLASAYLTMGNQYRLLGQFQPALHEYAIALTYAFRLLDELRIVEGLENSAVVLEHLGRLDEAASCYQLATQRQDSVLKTQEQTSALVNRRFNLLFKQGDLALHTGNLSKAETIFEENLKTLPSGMRELMARNRLALTEVYLRTERLFEAESTLTPALALSASGQYPEIEWQAKFMEGRLLEKKGRTHEALLSYHQSIQTIQRMRQNVKLGDLRQSFFIDRYDPFKAVVTLLFDTAGNRQELLEVIDKSKSTTLTEDLKHLHSMAEYLGDTTTAKENVYTLVEYFFARDKLLILLTTSKQVEVFTQNLSTAEMSRQVQQFLKSIKLGDYKSFQEISHRLYAELLAPVDAYAFAHESPETLVILPDGPLYLLPFAGLQDTSGTFLIEKAPVVFAPSRSVFRHCLLGDREPAATSNHTVLLIDGTAGLPNARDELAQISKLYSKDALILGAKQLPIPPALLKRTKILHFSGHAVIRQNQPLLLLQEFPKEIYLDCQTIRNWAMPNSELVNLAGCNTAIGPISEGEAPWGLIPAFLDAGTHAVLASLMEVDDASTKRLSCRFYDLLHKGLSKAKALQLAQIDLLNSFRADRTNKLQSWLPYILVGNPR